MADKNTKLTIIVDAQNKANKAFSDIQNNLDAIKKSNAGLITGIKSVGAIGAVAFAGLTAATIGFVKAGADFEQTTIAFETMLGSASEAKNLLKDLAEFSARTPFELTQLQTASKSLLAYGIESKKLIPTLQTLGNIAAGVGMDKLPQLILAFGQVKAATKLTGNELRQFTEAGVPVLEALAKHFGKTTAEVQAMVSEGAVGFADMEAALNSLTAEGGKFFNLMDKQSQSLGGLWSTIKDNVNLTAVAIGMQLVPVLKPLAEQLIQVLGVIRQWVEDNPKLAAVLVIVALAISGIMAVLLPLAFILPQLIAGFTIIGGIMTAVTVPGIIAVTLGLILLAVAIRNVWKLATEFQGDWDLIWLGIQLTVAGVVNSVVKLVEMMANAVIDGINSVIDTINNLIRKLASIPKIGGAFKGISIDRLDSVAFKGVDTDSLIQDTFSNRQATGTTNIIVSNNTLLDEDAGEKVGDMIMNKLKLSNAI